MIRRPEKGALSDWRVFHSAFFVTLFFCFIYIPVQIYLQQGGRSSKMCLSDRNSPEKKLPEIGLRLCGACNLTYDRDDLVRRLSGLLPEASFVAAQSGIRYAALLVIHGCPNACTSEFNLAVPENRRVRIGSPEDLPAAVEQLRRMIRM